MQQNIVLVGSGNKKLASTAFVRYVLINTKLVFLAHNTNSTVKKRQKAILFFTIIVYCAIQLRHKGVYFLIIMFYFPCFHFVVQNINFLCNISHALVSSIKSAMGN